MTQKKLPLAALLSSAPISIGAMLLASCGATPAGESSATAQSTPSPTQATTTGGPTMVAESPADETVGPFEIRNLGAFDEPWAGAFAPGTPVLFITEKPGTMKFVDTQTGRLGTVTGLPRVDYGGQGGLGDIAFLPSESASTLSRRTIYLSWAEAGSDNTRGAVVGRGTLVCEEADACRIDGLNVVWRQDPKVSGRGHYSHRIAFSPDERYMFVASGDRQKKTPAQDTSNNLGSIVRLNLDGTPAAGNPVGEQIWSYGHRNTLGLAFDEDGRLWNLEHGPAGGDELNLIQEGRNYGWPLVSGGDNYDGTPIPANSTRPDLAGPVINWTPVIAPGDFLFYGGDMFGDWQGDAIIAGLKTKAVIRVAMNGTSAREAGRYDLGERLRDIIEGPDGAIYVLEDGENGRLRRLTPAS